ncbi:MAG TPA: beta-ketoacyl-[acyl-carrier-protein] synthase family protein [Polyangiaceae bacterium]|jgi:3-oxoacyl-[acyl-carrier-protein] synthase II|nr:beta-ketoacyl-[acyl-carrier-protein] synthase family protein [Polyangiaceae bacterium]
MIAGRIAVTGVGIVSALGQSAETTYTRLVKGERGFSDVDLFDTSGQRTRFAGQVTAFAHAECERRTGLGPLSRSDALALAAARDAMEHAGGSAPAGCRFGIAVGATTGGMLEAETVLARAAAPELSAAEAHRFVSYPMSSTADRLAETFGAAVRIATLCTACSSGASAIMQAAFWLRRGDVDCALSGGTDALCRLTVTGFNALGASDAVPCRPFDRARGGLTLGEGAAFLVLETEERVAQRGARVLAWLSGWAAGAEAHHITQPEPTARLPARLLTLAMRSAGLAPGDVDYLNAHGTGTSNDAVESRGIRAAFGDAAPQLLVSSSKGQLGHTLGAAGAIEAAITVLSLDRQLVPPTGGLVEPDEECALNHVMSVGRPARLRAALSSAFGFGGAGAVLLFEEARAPRRAEPVGGEPATRRLAITGIATLGPRGIATGPAVADALVAVEGGTGAGASNPIAILEPARSRRFDVQTALVSLGAGYALTDSNLPLSDVGLVAGSAFGNVERTASFLRVVLEKGARRAPPAEFPHLLPSSSSGNASIYLGLTGPVLTANALDASAAASVSAACDFVLSGEAPGMVAGSVVVRDAFSREVLGPACRAPAQGHEDAAAFLVVELEPSARARGARIAAIIAERRELSESSPGALRVEPPRDRARAVVVGTDVARATALLGRTAWGPVPFLSGSAHSLDGANMGLAIAAAKLARGEVDDALVLEHAASRVYVFRLTRPS